MFEKNNIYGLYGSELFFLHVQQVVLPYIGRQPWPLRWWIYNRLRGKGTAAGQFGRFVFGTFFSMPRKLAGCFVEDISHQRLPVQVLVFVFVQLMLWSGWDASITQKTKRSFVEGSENPSPRLTVFECNSWSWKLVKLRICTLPRARSPLHFHVILVQKYMWEVPMTTQTFRVFASEVES